MPEESSEPRLVVEERVSTRVPTGHGEFRLHLYTSNLDRTESLALVLGDVRDRELVLVRVHSECLTGDVLGSLRCDCAGQLETALRVIAREGRGALIYLRQEGRGIGLREKLLAYNLQDAGLDTVDANLRLGHASDSRDYSVAAGILRLLGVHSIRLMTNNPEKIEELGRLGVRVAERVAIPPIVNNENRRYLITKAKRMGHLFQVG